MVFGGIVVPGVLITLSLCLREHHETDGDRDRVDLWYRNITKSLEKFSSNGWKTYAKCKILKFHNKSNSGEMRRIQLCH